MSEDNLTPSHDSLEKIAQEGLALVREMGLPLSTVELQRAARSSVVAVAVTAGLLVPLLEDPLLPQGWRVG